MSGQHKELFQVPSHFSSRRKTRKNVGTLPNEVDAHVIEDIENMQLLNAYFPSVFTAKDNPHQLRAMGARECLEKGRFSLCRGGSC